MKNYRGLAFLIIAVVLLGFLFWLWRDTRSISDLWTHDEIIVPNNLHSLLVFSFHA